MEKYKDLQISIPAKDRSLYNDNILMLIDSGNMQEVTQEEVFNVYTGIGGLHGLEFNKYENRHQFTEAKKEIENGQFFTPASIAQQMASLIELKQHEIIADLTCGAGVFINYFPERNVYGCELDSKAYKVAKFLYPDSNIELRDIRYYEAPVKFDYVIGNPPFNLVWDVKGDKVKSQQVYFTKAAEMLRPGGMILAIVPKSFCADPFNNKSEIESIEADYNFLFQVELSKETFKNLGVLDFPTKVLCLQKSSENLQQIKFDTAAFSKWPDAKRIFKEHAGMAHSIRIKANAELAKTDNGFTYKVKKYLYEIKVHKVLQPHYIKAVEYVSKYENQKCPANMSYEDWYRKHRTTPNDVIAYLKRIINKQNIKEVDKISLVKYTYGIKLKSYSGKSKSELANKYATKSWSFNDIVVNDIPYSRLPKMSRGLMNLIKRKKAAYRVQTVKFNEIEVPQTHSNYVSKFSWISRGNVCAFNDIQKLDIGRVLTKKYGILNWQQGSGKTSAGYAWAQAGKMKTFVVSSALSVNLTWTTFLKTNHEKFINVKTLSDVAKMKDYNFIIVSHGYMIKYNKQIKKQIKQLSYKVSMILDESDEITNHNAKRTKAIKNCFQQHGKRKLLTTGTTTRNNIAELYTQLELLYNNSINMLSTCKEVYIEDAKEKTISKEVNTYYNQPFPPYYGNRLFRNCFNPSKTTVFGIKQQNQNIYNEIHLRQIIESTIITRKFKEIAGDKYIITNQPVHQAPQERHVYRSILKDFHSIMSMYYRSTGNSRKEAALRLIRQIQLLIKATSTPQLFHNYGSTLPPNKALAIFEKIEQNEGRTAIGCVTIDSLEYYSNEIRERFPDRQLFVIKGDVNFTKRGDIIDLFQVSDKGILICTQQSLKSSVNIPLCKEVFIEALQWNIPTIEQFYFRFIRYDSVGITNVTFFNYQNTIESNLLALLMSKERLNDYIKTLEQRTNDDMFAEFGIDTGILDMIITKETDEEGTIYLRWGQQEIA